MILDHNAPTLGNSGNTGKLPAAIHGNAPILQTKNVPKATSHLFLIANYWRLQVKLCQAEGNTLAGN